MITPAYAQRMARYNTWQNENLYQAADRLPVQERTRQTGAFFGSIQGTLSHLVFADQAWMHRFDPSQPPQQAVSLADSPHLYPDWTELKAVRRNLDQVITTWADALTDDALKGEVTWFSGVMQANVSKPKWLLVTHVFNHQTHHCGQVHCMLTQAGVKPGDTDLPFQDI